MPAAARWARVRPLLRAGRRARVNDDDMVGGVAVKEELRSTRQKELELSCNKEAEPRKRKKETNKWGRRRRRGRKKGGSQNPIPLSLSFGLSSVRSPFHTLSFLPQAGPLYRWSLSHQAEGNHFYRWTLDRRSAGPKKDGQKKNHSR